MSGRCCWCCLLVLSDSSPTEDMGRGRKDHHQFCIQHKSTQGRCAGVLPVPKTFSLCPRHCVHALNTGTSCPGRALERAVPQGRAQLLLAQPSLAIRTCCVQPQALGTCPLPNHCLTLGAAAAAAGNPGGKSWGFQHRKFPNQTALWQ